jgi:hypothetical protein
MDALRPGRDAGAGRRACRDAFRGAWLALLVAIPLGCGAPADDSRRTEPSPMPPIAQVIERHAPELMKIPGVVGVYEGETRAHAPCIRIMVVKRTRDLEARLPRRLEGHPVEIEETGVIRPMQ